MKKDESILRFLARLTAAGDPSQWQVIDHWDADLMAVGITRAHTPQPLVYVSTYHLPAGRYDYECETAPPPGSDLPYAVASRGEGVDFSRLLSAIRDHLGIDLKEPT